MFTIELGVMVKDCVTGFRGVVMGRVEYLSGCNQYLILPKVGSDSKYTLGQWLDEQRLIIDISVDKIVLSVKDPGGPQENPAPEK